MRIKAAIITVMVVGALGCRSQDPGVSKNTLAQAQQSAGAQDPTDSESACDEYFRMVSKCIETKMPESESASEKQNLEMNRKMLSSPAFQTMAGDICRENILHAIQQDSYGCYAEEAKKRGVQTACTLLTRAELEQILQTPLQDGKQDGYTCRYEFPPNKVHEPFRIEVHFKDGRDEMDAARGALKLFGGKGPNSVGQFVAGETVKGVGDDAFFTVAGIEPMLTARLGDVAVSLVGGVPEQMLQIARKALPRIQPDPDARHEGDD
jgi:hypothetical protein